MNSSLSHGPDAQTEITYLLGQLGANDSEAESRLIRLIYDDLRRMASNYLRSERSNHTLQPTALVHEAYLRLVGGPQVNWQNREHFFATASRLMRNILVDYARSKRAAKRGGTRLQVALNEDLIQATAFSIDLMALDEAIDRLARFDPRQAKMAELHLFTGLEIGEIATLLGVSGRTVHRDWALARAWLTSELGGKA
jgi:RNA polymerase sigma-70 factor, ECF subfamily